jgi:hypothetical protein
MKLLNSFSSLEEIIESGPEKVTERCSIPIEVSDNLIKFIMEHLKISRHPH